MPDLVHNRLDLQAELESAAAAVLFCTSEPTAETEPSPEAEAIPVLVIGPAEIPEPVPLWRDRRAWISGASSFSVHLTAMIVLALATMILQDDMVNEAVNARLGDEEVAALDVNANVAELPRFDLASSPSFHLDPVEMERVTPGDLERRFAADRFAPAFTTESPDEGRGFLFEKPTNGKAVTQGSFAVWTEPNDPEPYEDYLIVIELAVPEKVKTFPASDLEIKVYGTDGFYLEISKTRRSRWLQGDLPIVDGKVQVSIRVPGAKIADVRDTIHVRSLKVLKEHQRMQIKF